MKAPDLRVVLGAGGSGKTHLVNHWIDKIGGRILIFDTNAEPAYAKGATITSSRSNLVDRILYHADKPWRIAWRGLEEGDFEFVNEVAWARENLTLVWEEVDVHIPGAARLPPFAFKLANQGRHRNVRIIACARRPARVSRDLTANASRITAFRTVEPRDVRYLCEFMGPGADQVPDLAPYTALDWTPKTTKIRKSPFA